MIDIKVVRALRYKGVSRDAGTVLTVPELDAADLLASSRAELVDPAAFAAIRAAIEARNVRLGPGRPPREGPWQRVGKF